MPVIVYVLYALSLFLTVIPAIAGFLDGRDHRRKLSKGDGVTFGDFDELVVYLKTQVQKQTILSSCIAIGAALGFIATVISLD